MHQAKGNSKTGLIGATLGFFVGFAAVALFGSTAAEFKDIMGLSATQIAFLVAAPTLSGSLLRIPFAAWVDVNGGRKPFLVLLMLSIIGMSGLLYVIAFFYPDQLTNSHYLLVLALGTLCGCGIATFSVGASQTAYWFPQKKLGMAQGIYAGVGNLAPGIFSFLLPVALTAWGLAGSYLAWLIFLVVGTGLYYRFGVNPVYFQLLKKGVSVSDARLVAIEKGQEFFPSGNFFTSLSRAASASETWVLVAIYFSTFGGFIALTAWLPTFFTAYYDCSLVEAGTLTAVFAILSSLTRIPGGRISDHFGGERTTRISLLCLLVGAMGAVFLNNFSSTLLSLVIIAIGMGVTNGAVFKLVAQKVPDAVGGAAGWVGGLGAFGGFLIPPCMSVFVNLAPRTGYAHGFAVFIVLAIISLVLVQIMMRQTAAIVDIKRESLCDPLSEKMNLIEKP